MGIGPNPQSPIQNLKIKYFKKNKIKLTGFKI